MGSINIGLQLTVFGMGLVFLLLGVMALLITFLLRCDVEKEPQAEESAADQAPAPRSSDGLDVDTLAAVMIAVARHRAVRRKAAAPEMRLHRPGVLPSRWVDIGRGIQNTSWQPGRRSQ